MHSHSDFCLPQSLCYISIMYKGSWQSWNQIFFPYALTIVITEILEFGCNFFPYYLFSIHFCPATFHCSVLCLFQRLFFHHADMSALNVYLWEMLSLREQKPNICSGQNATIACVRYCNVLMFPEFYCNYGTLHMLFKTDHKTWLPS